MRAGAGGALSGAPATGATGADAGVLALAAATGSALTAPRCSRWWWSARRRRAGRGPAARAAADGTVADVTDVAGDVVLEVTDVSERNEETARATPCEPAARRWPATSDSPASPTSTTASTHTHRCRRRPRRDATPPPRARPAGGGRGAWSSGMGCQPAGITPSSGSGSSRTACGSLSSSTPAALAGIALDRS